MSTVKLHLRVATWEIQKVGKFPLSPKYGSKYSSWKVGAKVVAWRADQQRATKRAACQGKAQNFRENQRNLEVMPGEFFALPFRSSFSWLRLSFLPGRISQNVAKPPTDSSWCRSCDTSTVRHLFSVYLTSFASTKMQKCSLERVHLKNFCFQIIIFKRINLWVFMNHSNVLIGNMWLEFAVKRFWNRHYI